MDFGIINLQTVLAALAVGGITWLIKHVNSTQLVIADLKHELELDMEQHTKKLDLRLALLEAWTIGHEKIEVEHQKTSTERYRSITKILEEVKVRQ